MLRLPLQVLRVSDVRLLRPQVHFVPFVRLPQVHFVPFVRLPLVPLWPARVHDLPADVPVVRDQVPAVVPKVLLRVHNIPAVVHLLRDHVPATLLRGSLRVQNGWVLRAVPMPLHLLRLPEVLPRVYHLHGRDHYQAQQQPRCHGEKRNSACRSGQRANSQHGGDKPQVTPRNSEGRIPYPPPKLRNTHK